MKFHVYACIAYCLFAFAPFSFAQPGSITGVTTFSGTVTDAKTGQPLPGASVNLPDIRRGAVAGSDGRFTIRGIGAAKYLVEVTYTGYASYVETIDLSDKNQLTFALNPSFLETEAVTVTGVSSATSVKRTPVPVTVVTRQELLRNAGTNIVDALSKNTRRSTDCYRSGHFKTHYSRPGLQQVVVVNDGIRQEGQQWGDEHGLEIDELNVQKAEVLERASFADVWQRCPCGSG